MASGATSRTDLDASAAPVEWRRLQHRLWVARAAGGPLGMVERGRGYTAVDRHDEVLGRFRTLEEAQDAVGGLLPVASASPASAPAAPATDALPASPPPASAPTTAPDRRAVRSATGPAVRVAAGLAGAVASGLAGYALLLHV